MNRNLGILIYLTWIYFVEMEEINAFIQKIKNYCYILYAFLEDYIKHPYLKYVLIVVIAVGFSLYKYTNKPVIASVKPTSVVSRSTSTETQTQSGQIYVDLSGAVKNPGVYSLPKDSRVGDLIKAGGGVSDSASTIWVSKYLNLAKKLNDGIKVYIPYESDQEVINDLNSNDASVLSGILDLPQDEEVTEVESAKSTLGEESTNSTLPKISEEGPTETIEASKKVNLNKSTSSDIDKLPGIGPVYAQKIISNRPYKDLNDFYAKSGLSKTLIDKFVSQVEF